MRAFAGRCRSRNRPGGRGPDSGVPRRRCGRKPSGGGVEVCPSMWTSFGARPVAAPTDLCASPKYALKL